MFQSNLLINLFPVKIQPPGADGADRRQNKGCLMRFLSAPYAIYSLPAMIIFLLVAALLSMF